MVVELRELFTEKKMRLVKEMSKKVFILQISIDDIKYYRAELLILQNPNRFKSAAKILTGKERQKATDLNQQAEWQKVLQDCVFVSVVVE